MMYKEFFEKKFKDLDERYDEEYGMPFTVLAEWNTGSASGYHTRISGKVHPTVSGASYPEFVYILKKTDRYDKAERCLRKLISLQDKDPESRTYGLWSYYAEEPLEKMLAPDYNWTDFICRIFLHIMKQHGECLSEDLKALLKTSMRMGAECSRRRNVSADYTNISIMSLNTIIGAAEVCEDEALLDYGRNRLAKVLAYDKFCNSFSEYNSPCYTLILLEELARMRALFQDKECLRMAEELDQLAWRMFAMHYHAASKQMAPPHIRAYHDFADENLAMVVYLGTEGKYGAFSEKCVEMTRLPYRCPKEYWHYFEPVTEERFVSEAYYRKNDLRDPKEDTTIIRNVDSPDLWATTYMKPDYSLGSFRLCDTWVQRHNCMAFFGTDPERLTAFRLRCLKGDEEKGAGYQYDTCMGFVTAAQEKNKILGQIALTTDHGDFHYILDKTKSGIYPLDSLFFRFGFTGCTEGITAQKTENGYCFVVGEHQVFVSVYLPIFDGKEAKLVWREKEKALDLVLTEEKQLLDLRKLSETGATFTISIDEEMAPPVIRKEGDRRVAEWGDLKVLSPVAPTAYDDAVAIAADFAE